VQRERGNVVQRLRAMLRAGERLLERSANRDAEWPAARSNENMVPA
jgi:hypothetical protein